MDELRLSDLEPRFVCKACGKSGLPKGTSLMAVGGDDLFGLGFPARG
jgi:hypothetical protein